MVFEITPALYHKTAVRARFAQDSRKESDFLVERWIIESTWQKGAEGNQRGELPKTHNFWLFRTLCGRRGGERSVVRAIA